MNNKLLTEQDYLNVSKSTGIEVALIKAVADVESSGNGFLDDGNCKILFEPYQFGRLTQHKYDNEFVEIGTEKYPLSLSGTWDGSKCKYGDSCIQWIKLTRALELDRTAAMKSCSWGKFQIIARNYKECGYNDVEDFVENMCLHEKLQLSAFVKFLYSTNIIQYLKSHDWVRFAEGYNGGLQAQNKYSDKIQAAYFKYSSKS